MKCFGKMVLTAAAGWLAMSLTMLVTFRGIGFGWDGHGVLLDPRWQSQKLILVWTQLEPLPLIISRPPIIIFGMYAFAFTHAVIYRTQAVQWPTGVWKRAMRLAALIFFACYCFWEFFTPFNQFGEPLPLIGLELLFWALVAIAESMAIAFTAERLWPCLRESCISRENS
ncbi:MAG: hypothetical protein U0941_08070 [Planctomycetaceae bacterium]